MKKNIMTRKYLNQKYGINMNSNSIKLRNVFLALQVALVVTSIFLDYKLVEIAKTSVTDNNNILISLWCLDMFCCIGFIMIETMAINRHLLDSGKFLLPSAIFYLFIGFSSQFLLWFLVFSDPFNIFNRITSLLNLMIK